MGTQMVFKRYEIKYLLDRKQKEKILEAMEPYMALDGYGRSTIRNIYYDTDTYRLVRKSLEKPVYKEKLRARSKKLKKKLDGIVYKRRIAIAERQACAYLSGRSQAPVQTQITRELDYFLEFYQTLAPRVFLSYEREAYFTKEPSDFRVTFDESILWRETDLSLQKGVYGENILKPGQALMEIKTPGNIPLWMVKVLSEEGIRKTSFSKYGNAYETMMKKEKGEKIYA